jgi:hypothetical protein
LPDVGQLHREGLSDLVGELSTRSEKFRVLSAAHDVLLHRTGTKNLHHPVAGDLDPTYEAFELSSEPGLRMLVYTAEPDTPTAQALDFLASWATTTHALDATDRRRPATRNPPATLRQPLRCRRRVRGGSRRG